VDENAAVDLVKRTVEGAIGDAVEVIVTHGYRDALHVIVVSKLFEDETVGARNKRIWPHLRSLDPEILLRISVLMTLTPEEYDELLARREMLV